MLYRRIGRTRRDRQYHCYDERAYGRVQSLPPIPQLPEAGTAEQGSDAVGLTVPTFFITMILGSLYNCPTHKKGHLTGCPFYSHLIETVLIPVSALAYSLRKTTLSSSKSKSTLKVFFNTTILSSVSPSTSQSIGNTPIRRMLFSKVYEVVP